MQKSLIVFGLLPQMDLSPLYPAKRTLGCLYPVRNAFASISSTIVVKILGGKFFVANTVT
jgi:hypothetical protein